MTSLAPSADFNNVAHFREVVGSIQPGQKLKLAVIFYDPMAQPCWEPTAIFHQASTDPTYGNMRFFSINASSSRELEGMDEVLEELRVTFVPVVAFWDGRIWEKVTLTDSQDVLTALATHQQ